MNLDLIRELRRPADTTIVLLVLDGLGGMPDSEHGGLTELEAARTPNLDRLAAEGICGLHEPVAAGITPGSGPSHLAVFGYDPFRFDVGRGVLSALGIDFDLRSGDVAARGNFATVDGSGNVTDRRAGRIPTDTARRLCEKLRTIDIPGVELFVQAEKEHRFVLVLRGEDLDDDVEDTDPQRTGVPPVEPRAGSETARRTAEAVATFVDGARRLLSGEDRANMVLLRGFASLPDWPSLGDVAGMRTAAVAGYPMYRGVARLLGMDIVEAGAKPEESFPVVRQQWDGYDFFYVHVKKTDSAGEDGDFERKLQVIEDADRHLPTLLGARPDVLVVTGDHSTPSQMRSHSWHPVPVLLWAPDTCRPDRVERFGERECLAGALGPRIPAPDLMSLALAHAGRLTKFGA